MTRRSSRHLTHAISKNNGERRLWAEEEGRRCQSGPQARGNAQAVLTRQPVWSVERAAHKYTEPRRLAAHVRRDRKVVATGTSHDRVSALHDMWRLTDTEKTTLAEWVAKDYRVDDRRVWQHGTSAWVRIFRTATLPPAVETLFYYYAYGKPKERLEVGVEKSLAQLVAEAVNLTEEQAVALLAAQRQLLPERDEGP